MANKLILTGLLNVLLEYALRKNIIEVFKLIVEYAEKNRIILNINDKYNYRTYPLFLAQLLEITLQKLNLRMM